MSRPDDLDGLRRLFAEFDQRIDRVEALLQRLLAALESRVSPPRLPPPLPPLH